LKYLSGFATWETTQVPQMDFGITERLPILSSSVELESRSATMHEYCVDQKIIV
jgi:hypothetical protein